MNSSAVPDLLFVYGTLRYGGTVPLARRLCREGTLLGAGQAPGKLYRISWYPGVVPHPIDGEDPGMVWGDVFRLPPDQPGLLAELDRFEDFRPASPEAGEYFRGMTEVQMHSTGVTLSAWIYWYQRPVDEKAFIPSGDWREWCTSQGNIEDPPPASLEERS